MVTGTTLWNYATIASPRVFAEEKGTWTEAISTIGMLMIPEKTAINNNYKLRMDTVAEVRVENNKYIVVDYQIDEYGIGDSLEEARRDLLSSLVDYLTSLERRANRLGDREGRNLDILKQMLVKTN